MFGVALGATDAKLSIDPELRAAVEGTSRAVKVVVDRDAEKLVAEQTQAATPSLSDDFAAIAEILDDNSPCLVLVHLGVEGGGDDSSWAMVAWTPDNSPVKLRMLCASSRKTLREEFSDLTFKEYPATMKNELTFKDFVESTRARTDDDRKKSMTREELDHLEVKKMLTEEQRTAPKRLSGLVALKVQVLRSFEDAVGQMLAEDDKAVLCRLVGSNGEELSGEILDDAATPAQLSGRLPTDEPCYLLLRAGPSRLLFASWLPDDVSAKKKMRVSTFKSSVLDAVKGLTHGQDLVTAEICGEEDLDDSLINAHAPVVQPDADAGVEASPSVKATPSGPRLPPGAVAMPGMPGMPAGAVAMPGMGAAAAELKRRSSPQACEAPPQAVAEEVPRREGEEDDAAAAQKEKEDAREAAQQKQQEDEAEAARKKKAEEEEEAARKQRAAEDATAARKKKDAEEAESARKNQETQDAESVRLKKHAEEEAVKKKQQAEADARQRLFSEEQAAGKVETKTTTAPEGCYTLEQLQDADVWRALKLPATERETFLADDKFKELFAVSKDEFAKQPKWKRDGQKKKHGLF